MIRRWLVAACCLLLSPSGCNHTPPTGGTKASPAQVAVPANEQELATITLTPQAVKRLAVATSRVRQKTTRRRRTLGGEVIVPPGRAITVSAPLAGRVAEPDAGMVPPPGATVMRGQVILNFTPLLSPEREVLTPADRVTLAEARAKLATSQIESERQVETAKVQLSAAETALGRAQQLERDGAGSRKAVEDAQAAFGVAREALLTAQARHELLSGISLDVEAGALSARQVVAPIAGKLLAVHAAPGETVGPGEPLFDIVRDDRVWVRVPVYAGAWREIDSEAPAMVRELGAALDSPAWKAEPIAAPPSADAAKLTVDLVYELDNARAQLRPSQKVAATVTLRAEERAKVVPWAAVLHDIHGGAWVYENVSPRTFVRRRVAVKYVAGAQAVLAEGPAVGARIVTDGAAELFGTEFGFGK
ncbi:MAG: efflux RND transporter periplasmic adaptor subunit [Pirellulales bacterium]